MTAESSPEILIEPKAKPPRWGFWGTILWAIVIALVVAVVQGITGFFFYIWWESAHPGNPLDLSEISSNGPLLGVATLTSTAAALGVIAFAISKSGVSISEYLALHWPSRRNLLIGLLATAIMLPLAEFITQNAVHVRASGFMTGIYESAQSAGPFFSVLLAITLTILAPVGEETVFRGFLFRGFSQSLGPFAAIVLTSLLWAGMHIQYETIFMWQILLYGIVFGWVRWRSNSLLLAILLHAIINSLALAQIGGSLGG